MRWFPLAMFVFLFWLPNYLGWIDSPDLDYWALLALSGLFVIAYPGARSRSRQTAMAPARALQQPGISALAWLFLLIGSVAVLPYSAVLHSVAAGGFNAEIREESLKLAPPYVAVVVNIFRDAVIPFLIITSARKGQSLRWMGLWITFVFFATFNLAKSFLIINTLAVFMALFNSPILMGISAAVLLVPILVLLAFLYGGIDVNLQVFLLDFLIRRILTLTPELGVNVREFITANGFYWGSNLDRAFEYELFSFIQHSNLQSGWANVYAVADAYGRGGIMGVVLAFIIIGIYLLFFWLLVRPISPRFAVYLWALFCIYVFMQGVFSFGLLISFLIGPSMALMFRGTLLDYRFALPRPERLRPA